MLLAFFLFFFIGFFGSVILTSNEIEKRKRRYGGNYNSEEIYYSTQHQDFVLGSSILTTIVMCTWVLYLSDTVYDFKKEELQSHRINLESAKTISNTTGNFFYIYSGEKYSSFVKNEDGGLSKIYFPDTTVIYEKDIDKPYLTYEKCYSGERLDYLFGIGKDTNVKCSNKHFNGAEYNHKLYIPKGSIELKTLIK